MARYTDPSCRLCRRERQKLFLKGTKCFTEKCPVERRGFPPGQHGQSRRPKVSEYGVQLREKQKIRRTYGTAKPPATCVPAMPAAAMPAIPIACGSPNRSSRYGWAA